MLAIELRKCAYFINLGKGIGIGVTSCAFLKLRILCFTPPHLTSPNLTLLIKISILHV